MNIRNPPGLPGGGVKKNEDLKSYLSRYGSKMVEEVENEEELLNLFRNFRDIGYSQKMVEKALALSGEKEWISATAYILEVAGKSQNVSFSL